LGRRQLARADDSPTPMRRVTTIAEYGILGKIDV
jgi:hypothetical protein